MVVKAWSLLLQLVTALPPSGSACRRPGGLLCQSAALKITEITTASPASWRSRGAHEFLVLPIGRSQKTSARQTENDVGLLQGRLDFSRPFLAGGDLAVRPGGDQAFPLQQSEMLAELLRQSLIFTGVRDQQLQGQTL
jgi:hypothetical protein